MNKDYFALFDLPVGFKQDLALIKLKFLQLQKRFHPDNFINNPHEKRLAIEYASIINQAYQTLQDPLKRALYLLKQWGVEVRDEPFLDEDFLNEQMELHEKMAQKENNTFVQDYLKQALNESEQALHQLLTAPNSKELLSAQTIVKKMQFYQRLQQQLLSE